MSISRKEFFRRGLFTLGDTLLKGVGAAQASEAQQQHDCEPDKQDDGLPRHATADNEHCLARNCGCFSCIERCERQAITIAFGIGIKVDTDLCVGCGACYAVCPLTPKAIRLVSREHLEHQQG